MLLSGFGAGQVYHIAVFDSAPRILMLCVDDATDDSSGSSQRPAQGHVGRHGGTKRRHARRWIHILTDFFSPVCETARGYSIARHWSHNHVRVKLCASEIVGE